MANILAKPVIGYLGVGTMGAPMAHRLREQGFPVSVYSRAAARLQPFIDRGVPVAHSPAELAAGSEVIISCVTDDAAVQDLYQGTGAALAAARPGTLIIEMSTVLPETSRRLAAAAVKRQVQYLDAPVSGSVSHAGTGQLVIFAGGPAEAYQRAVPILGALGRAHHHLGPSGSGNIMKLLVNAILGTALQSLGEAIAMGLAGGLDRTTLIDALAQTTVVNPSQKAKLENIKHRQYPTTFRLSLMAKDFALINQYAAQNRIPLPVTATAAATYTAALRTGNPDDDYSSIIRFLEQQAGLG